MYVCMNLSREDEAYMIHSMSIILGGEILAVDMNIKCYEYLHLIFFGAYGY